MKKLQHTADLHCIMTEVITITQSLDGAVLTQNIPRNGKYISRLVEEYETYNLEAVIVTKYNIIIAAIIHGATVL